MQEAGKGVLLYKSLHNIFNISKKSTLSIEIDIRPLFIKQRQIKHYNILRISIFHLFNQILG